jgi:hypothetical protein
LFRNRRKALSLLSAIEFECRFAEQICSSYKRDSLEGTRAWAPTYRVSINELEGSLPWLRDLGFLLPKEVDELARLGLRMHEVNYCLSLVEEGVKQCGGDEDRAHFFYSRQAQRCALKCDHVLGPVEPDNLDGTVPGARQAIVAARRRLRRWWRPMWTYS